MPNASDNAARLKIGQPVPRLEDARLITGVGTYFDDIDRPGQLYAHFVRAPVPHARVAGIDSAAATEMPGVVAVLTAADLAADGVGQLFVPMALKNRDGSPMRNPVRPALTSTPRHVGDTVAMVIADSPATAADAAEAVFVDYEDRPAVTEARQALEAGAPEIWPDEAPGNLCLDWEMGDRSAVDRAFAEAAHVARIATINNRIVVSSMECRGAIGEYDPQTGRYTLTTPTQGVTPVHKALANSGLNVPMADIRVLTPEVGGGFGIKNQIYPEQVLVCWAAKRLGRPVKWAGDRSDDFITTAHARDHWQEGELALDADGRFLAIRTHHVSNMGAYVTASGPVIPSAGGSRMAVNIYRIPAVHCVTQCAFTNTAPIAAYRGAGKPEYCYLVERLVDVASREMGIDPVDLRRRNMVRPEDLPWRTPTGLTYDSGDPAANMDRALALAGHDGFAERRAEAAARGMRRGLGIAVYTEPDGFRDNRVDMQFDANGVLTVAMSAQTNGQGHVTTFAQVASDLLGLPASAIRVVQGDSDRGGPGEGTGGSRTATVSGAAMHYASAEIIEKGRQIAAHLLEASAADIEFADGQFEIAGTDRAVDILTVAKAAFQPGSLPEGISLGLGAAHHYDAPEYSYPVGCHVCEVEIDPDTGGIAVVGYVTCSDHGVVINPLLLDGQVHGGVAQGIGQALLEQGIYDADTGQLLTGSFMDYALPRANHLPYFTTDRLETRCETNPLGVKGVGESGTTCSLPATINAVIDALAPLGVRHIDMPATPHAIWRAIKEAS